MNLATGCAYNANELFQNLDLSKLQMTKKQANEANGMQGRRKYCVSIFLRGLKLIMDDLIDNNNTFLMPTQPRKSNIHIRRYYDDEFKKLRREGKWKDVDFLESNFTAYQPILEWTTKSNYQYHVPIYLAGDLKDKLDENTNNGKQYC